MSSKCVFKPWKVKESDEFDSFWPHALQPARLLCPWNSPARILEWVAIPFSRGFPNPGIEPRSPGLQADPLPPESPIPTLTWFRNSFFSSAPRTLSPTAELKLTSVALFLTFSVPTRAAGHKVLSWNVQGWFVILQNKYSLGDKRAKW